VAQDNPYEVITVESFRPKSSSGKHGAVHIRPIPEQDYSVDLSVEGNKSMSRDYPVGTKFEVRAKLTDRKGGGEYLYTSYKWPFKVID
tara:strand:+ start:169 stop:432 length:264 start_codon:yes stop_codon:yes gene_type:complete